MRGHLEKICFNLEIKLPTELLSVEMHRGEDETQAPLLINYFKHKITNNRNALHPQV